MSDKIQPDDLSAMIGADLSRYADEVIDGVKAKCKAEAKKCCESIKEDSPVKTGKYKRGWKTKTDETPLSILCTIYNSTEPHLTHLLENGHATRDGGRTRAFPHIKKNEIIANEEFSKEAEDVIRNGH